MNKPMKFLIIFSILLNILLGGIIIGHILHHMHGAPKFPVGESNLPSDKKILAKKIFAGIEQANKDSFEDMKKMRDEMMDVLTAENFDETAYDAQIEKMGTLSSMRKQRMADAIKLLAKGFDQEERIALAEMLRKTPPGFNMAPNPPPPHAQSGN